MNARESVRLELHAHAAELVERVAHEKQLGLDVRAGSPGAAGEPGPADLEPAMLGPEGQVPGAPERCSAARVEGPRTPGRARPRCSRAPPRTRPRTSRATRSRSRASSATRLGIGGGVPEAVLVRRVLGLDDEERAARRRGAIPPGTRGGIETGVPTARGRRDSLGVEECASRMQPPIRACGAGCP